MNFYSEVLPILLIWAALIAGGGIAWWRKARKTACCLWATVVWMVVGTWWSSRQTPDGRQTAITEDVTKVFATCSQTSSCA